MSQEIVPITTTVEERVKEYFKDEPIMIEVARCESHFSQFEKDGKTIKRGRANPQDVGALQINEFYHLEDSRKLGMNIYTLEGNLQYARYLYEKQGTRPWKASSPCWKPKLEINNLALVK